MDEWIFFIFDAEKQTKSEATRIFADISIIKMTKIFC
jgi:hypothetical protein